MIPAGRGQAGIPRPLPKGTAAARPAYDSAAFARGGAEEVAVIAPRTWRAPAADITVALFRPTGGSPRCEYGNGGSITATRLSATIGAGQHLIQVGALNRTGGVFDYSIRFDPDLDLDDDGYTRPQDCNDRNARVHPGAIDQADNGVDEDCSGGDRVDLDRDRDGFLRPSDCNDRAPAVHPGAIDVFDNGVDEDCSGGDRINLDRDGDGFLRPGDCDDGNRAVRPGARDVPGNRRDEDCSGGPAPFPLLESVVGAQWRFHPFRLARLYVRRVLAGTRIEVRCRGRGCPRRRFVVRVRRASSSVSVLGRLRGAALRRGAVVEVRVKRRGYDGVMRRLTIRGAGKDPASVDLCLPARGGRPKRC